MFFLHEMKILTQNLRALRARRIMMTLDAPGPVVDRRRRRSSFGDDTELSQRSRAAGELERATIAERTRRASRDFILPLSPYSYPVERPGVGPCRIYV